MLQYSHKYGEGEFVLLTITGLESFPEVRKFAANRLSNHDTKEMEHGHTEILRISSDVNKLQHAENHVVNPLIDVFI